jgi:Bromodomain associated/Transcription factor TFIID complex subunit 8 C-term
MADADSFARAVTAQAVAHACAALNLDQAYTSVLESLTDVTAHFVEAIGRLAHDNAERAGRSPAEINLTDVLSAFAQMPQSSGGVAWRDLQEFAFSVQPGESVLTASTNWEQPFHHSVPQFPVRKQDVAAAAGSKPPPFSRADADATAIVAATAASSSSERSTAYSHISAFLPALPPEHACAPRRKSSKEAEQDQSKLRGERLKRKREASEALRKLDAGISEAPTAAVASTALTIKSEAVGSDEVADGTHWPKRRRDAVEQWSYSFKGKPAVQSGGSSVAAAAPAGSQLRLKHGRLSKEDQILDGSYIDGDAESRPNQND